MDNQADVEAQDDEKELQTVEVAVFIYYLYIAIYAVHVITRAVCHINCQLALCCACISVFFLRGAM